MGKRIVVTSGKGGVGKTTVTANLGRAFAARNKKTVLIDADIGLNNLDIVMAVENRIVFDLGDIAEGKCRIRQALIPDSSYPELFTLPSARASCEALTDKVFARITAEVAENCDYVLIDCPAGIDGGFRRAVGAADMALTVTTPHLSASRDAFRASAAVATLGIKDNLLVVNRYISELVKTGDMLSAEDIAEILGLELAGVIPENVAMNVNFLASGNSASAFYLLAKKLDGDDKIVDTLRGKLMRMFR